MNWSKFTPKCHEIIQLAKQYISGTSTLTSESLLFALIQDDSIRHILKGIPINEIEDKLRQHCSISNDSSSQYVRMDKNIYKVLDIATSISRTLNQHHVGPEHILAAICKERTSTASQILTKYTDYFKVSREILNLASSVITSKSNNKPIVNCKYLINMANTNRMPFATREKEINRIISILLRKTKNNPLLVGEPGVGKTCIVEALAHRISLNNVPEVLKDYQIYSLDALGLLAGTSLRGQFEEKMEELIKEVKGKRGVVLFIDEIHCLVDLGSSDGAMSAANILKQPLSSGEIKIIGATTFAEYYKHFAKDSAFERRFQQVVIEEPTYKDSMKIANVITKALTRHHNVAYSEDVIKAALDYSLECLPNRRLPDKMIDILDEVGSYVRSKAYDVSLYYELEELRQSLSTEKDPATIGRLKDREMNLLLRIKNQKDISNMRAQMHDVEQTIFQMTNIPVGSIQSERLQTAKQTARQDGNVVMEKIVDIVKANCEDKKMPAFILVGHKANYDMAKSAAHYICGDYRKTTYINLSDYSDDYMFHVFNGVDISNNALSNSDGIFVSSVKKSPYSVIFMDNVNMASPRLQEFISQIIDSSECRDSYNNLISLRNIILILSVTIQKSELNKQGLGFIQSPNEDLGTKAKEVLRQSLKDKILELEIVLAPEHSESGVK